MQVEPTNQYSGSMMDFLFSDNLHFNQPSALQEGLQTLTWNWYKPPLLENPHPIPTLTSPLPQMAVNADPEQHQHSDILQVEVESLTTYSLPLLPPVTQFCSPSCSEVGNGAPTDEELASSALEWNSTLEDVRKE